MEQKLSNSQVRILLGLSEQRKKIQEQAMEIQKAEKEYMDMLISHYELEDGMYKFSQKGNEIFIVEQGKTQREPNTLMENDIDMEA